ncbi:DoxX family protein [Salinimicrobium oceani]|uniref:DoxX family protein n=1 Tax=Salinimicrobium oceani TaxID=2722702 RepID=A0ABX1D3A5_9FLAO|nr:DoxX family protein [Salinimicrobium oceani]NJW53822.1 DoxX family protein [Salinimicrobium oceani]
MTLSEKLDKIHLEARKNRWLRVFSIFNRCVLALGFFPSGFVKVSGERFTALATTHPMGSYLEAFFHTGFYYPFVGVMQILAAFLLLIPRTTTLGALIYFPIILNICLLSIAVRFEGSLLTSPLMLLACLYLLCWDWHKLKFIFFPSAPKTLLPSRQDMSSRFPVKFFFGSAITVIAVVAMVVLMNIHLFMPQLEISECKQQCSDEEDPQACLNLCDCIHTTRTYNFCMEEYDNSSAKNIHSQS